LDLKYSIVSTPLLFKTARKNDDHARI